MAQRNYDDVLGEQRPASEAVILGLVVGTIIFVLGWLV